MSSVKKFEDLICFDKARTLTRSVYHALRECKDYGFKDQIQRASVSIVSNIAEGFERGTRQEFLNYLFIAKGSAGEVRAQLYVALDIGYIDRPTFEKLSILVQECSRLIQSFAEKVKSGSRRGVQFKPGMENDPGKEVLRKWAPEIYKERYGGA